MEENKKKEFITPEIEIVEFDDEEDIIETSGIANMDSEDFNSFFGF